MKRIIKTVFWLGLSGLLSVQADWVYSVRSSFLTTGDLNGDGIPDVVLADKSNAMVRVGYQSVHGTLSWAQPRSLGLDSITGLSCGRVLTNSADVLVACAPELNRFAVYSLPSSSSLVYPLALYGSGVGPYSIVAADFGGTTSVHDDLLAVSTMNGTSPYKAEGLRSDGTNLTSVGTSTIGGAWHDLNETEYVTGSNAVGVIDPMSSGYLRLYTVISGTLVSKAFAGLSGAVNSGWVSMICPSQTNSDYLVWSPDSSYLKAYRYVTNSSALQVLGSYNLNDRIDGVQLVNGGGQTLLAVSFDGGQSSAIYTYSGTSAPVRVQSLRPPSGESLIGYVPVAAGKLIMLSSASGDLSGAVTVNARTWSAGQFADAGTVVLDAPDKLSSRANVMTFEGEPFVDSTPNRLQLLRAADWSVASTLTPSIRAVSLTDSGISQGASNPVTNQLGAAAAGAAYTLNNQPHDSVSIYSLDSARGESVAVVTVSPDPGVYGTSVEVSFSVTPSATVYYRTAETNSWTVYGFPFRIFAESDVQYFARLASGESSIIQTASYSFSENPSNLDSDGDGIPDYVEIANNIDPEASGLDADGDGYSDLDELLRGSDPNDFISVPAGERLEYGAVYDLATVLLARDGISNVTREGQTNTQVRLFSPSGSQLGYAAATNLPPPVHNPSVLFESVPFSLEPPFVVELSEPRFDLRSVGAGNQRGVELLGVCLSPDAAVSNVTYLWQGGSLSAESAAWLAEARFVYTNFVRVVQTNSLSVNGTLSALLVERKLADVLLQRGTVSNGCMTLFSGRAGDVGMNIFDAEMLESIEGPGPNEEPAYHLPDLINSIHSGLSAYPRIQLLALELYDICSQYGGDTNQAGQYGLPVDVLREFIYSGTVQSNYLAEMMGTRGWTTGLVAQAYSQSTQLLAGVTARPVGNFELSVRTNSFVGGCPVLYTAAGVAKSLYDANGRAYRFPLTFTLQAGAEVLVEAYTDVDWNDCPGTDPLEVISLSLTAVATTSPGDANSNLIPDDYENLFLAGGGGSATNDLDGDGFCDLQEYLDETDPASAASFGSSGPVDLSPPLIDLAMTAGSDAEITVNWPAGYASPFVFTIEYCDDLTEGGFLTQEEIPYGQLKKTVDGEGRTVQFYRVRMRLR